MAPKTETLISGDLLAIPGVSIPLSPISPEHCMPEPAPRGGKLFVFREGKADLLYPKTESAPVAPSADPNAFNKARSPMNMCLHWLWMWPASAGRHQRWKKAKLIRIASGTETVFENEKSSTSLLSYWIRTTIFI